MFSLAIFMRIFRSIRDTIINATKYRKSMASMRFSFFRKTGATPKTVFLVYIRFSRNGWLLYFLNTSLALSFALVINGNIPSFSDALAMACSFNSHWIPYLNSHLFLYTLFVREGLPGDTFTLTCLRSVNILTSINSLTSLQMLSTASLIFFFGGL